MILGVDRLEQSELSYLLALAVEHRDALARTRPELAAVFAELLAAADDERIRRADPRTRRDEERRLRAMFFGLDAFCSTAGGWICK